MAKKRELELNVEELGRILESLTACAFTTNGQWKCTFDFEDFLLQIVYEIADGFYRVKIEGKRDGLLQTTLFLTKSKRFHKEVKHLLTQGKLYKKSFNNHVVVVSQLMKSKLNADDLAKMEEQHPPDLRFDGIFI